MSPVALLLVSVLGASDPCVLPEAVGPGDPAAAAPYLEVAEEERAAGSLDTALAAYQEALRHDPTSAPARAGLEALCAARRPPTDETLARALELLDAGKPEAALAVLASEADVAHKPEVALLQGLAQLALGEDEAAEASLRIARDSPDTAPTAALYLAILSLRRGAAREAEALLETAATASDARISHRAAALLPNARREGRLSLAVRVGADYDSNVDLAPTGVSQPEGDADMALGAVAALAFQPLGPSGPFVRAVGHARRHRQFYGLDVWGAGAEAGWTHESSSFVLSGALGLDYAALNSTPYLWAPRVAATARGLLGPLVLEAQGQFQWEDFVDPSFADYTGPYASGQLGLSWRSESGRLELGLSYAVGDHGARMLPLATLEQGPRAQLWVRPLTPVRVGLSVDAGWRRYAAFDPALSAQRQDRFVDSVLTVDCALSSYWSVQAQLSNQLVGSNVERFSHTRWVGGLAVVGSFGLF